MIMLIDYYKVFFFKQMFWYFFVQKFKILKEKNQTQQQQQIKLFLFACKEFVRKLRLLNGPLLDVEK